MKPSVTSHRPCSRKFALDSPAMHDEIFGPILPGDSSRLARRGTRDITQARPHPLAMYIFSDNSAERERLLLQAQTSGGAVINDTMYHLANPALPVFGGVGASGMGAYHGKTGFDTFSHLRAPLHGAAHALRKSTDHATVHNQLAHDETSARDAASHLPWERTHPHACTRSHSRARRRRPTVSPPRLTSGLVTTGTTDHVKNGREGDLLR